MIAFVVARLAFGSGCWIRPVYRAFCFAGAAYFSLGLLALSVT